MRHIWEKCENLTEEDRERALAMRQAPGLIQGGFARAVMEPKASPVSSYDQDNFEGQSQGDTNMHIEAMQALQREPSALDTLAEVSRQHLDLSRQRQVNGVVTAQTSTEDAGHDLDGLYAQLRQSLAENSRAESEQASAGAQQSVTSTAGHNTPLMQTASAANDLHAALLQNAAEGAPEGADGQEGLRLALTMNAQEEMEANARLDPQLQSTEGTIPSGLQHRDPTAPAYTAQMTHNPVNASSPHAHNTSFAHTAVYPGPSARYGLLLKPQKKQRRGKFTDDRRKEVQGVRKLGACIRCRMLKKPCSGEMPCNTCRIIHQARMWKIQCVRTRIVDEFSLYSTSLFHARSHAKVNCLLVGMTLEKVTGRIEATLLPETQVYATFNPMITKVVEKSDTELDPLLDGQADKSTKRETYLLDFESDDVTGKLECYLVDTTDKIIEQEPSLFLKTTLGTATQLIGQEGDVLLAKAVNLWIATQVLASASESRWSLSYVADRMPSHEPEFVADHTRMSGSTTTLPPDSHDYDGIRAQLLDAAERYCARQGKSVMNELERRLLQRQSSAAFTTFLISVILLNCVERMTRIYRTFDEENAILPANTTDATDEANPEPETVPMPYTPPDWPLDAPPSACWSQGHSFSTLFHLLLRMRGLPPRTVAREDGKLVVVDDSKPYPLEVLAEALNKPNTDSQAMMMAEWVERTGATVEQLEAAKNISDGITDDFRGWDLKFIAALLLPA